MTAPPAVRLSDRYLKREGTVLLSGLQALVRLPLDQHRLDRAQGLDTRTLISGYEGSPLGGYDLELTRQQELLTGHGIVVRPNVNEELAANAVQGTQLASVVGTRTCDGVVGIWYGKAPGLDRASDALRHANLGGAAPTGGVVVLVGDDAVAKSSTVPSNSEMAMAEIGMVVLSPADPADILRLGLHAIALSRFSGLWVGLKLATNVVDGTMTVPLHQPMVAPVIPDNTVNGVPYVHTVSARFLQPHLGELERTALTLRPELAVRYARSNGLNRVVGDPAARLGVITAGLGALECTEALRTLGVTLDRPGCGVAMLRLGMVAPLDAEAVIEFADGLDAIVVVEEKRPFLENAVKAALYGTEAAPPVYGRLGVDGEPLLRANADLPAEVIAAAIAPLLTRMGLRVTVPSLEPPPRRTLPLLPRTPYFCSGCPHNRSTVTPPGALVAAGIGCHALVAYMAEDRVGDILGLCQMGGEGAAWMGLSPFVEERHVYANIGDGTYHHSGSLAVRAAVAAGVDMTYKLLYNGAVAMTGGQPIVGMMAIPQLVADLLAEGVAQVAITTDEPERYASIDLPRGVTVHHRDRLTRVQAELAAVPGVTVLIHDQACATELRRSRKRGRAADPTTRVFINERVCEGCGDCGQVSNCLSVVPVPTDDGRKTRIDQTSCNRDYSCLAGDCPSFVTVEPDPDGPRLRTPGDLGSHDLPAPPAGAAEVGVNIRMTGIGGTGVVTAAQVVATAAMIDGWQVRGLDQLGLSQKGGAVVSDLRLTRAATGPPTQSNRLGPGSCDLHLAGDLLVAAAESNLAVMARDRTAVVVSTTEVPTGQMVADPAVGFPARSRTLAPISDRAAQVVSLDARAECRALFGDDQYAGIFLLGVAVQAGHLPLTPAAVEAALTLNAAAVAANLQAFRRGRQHVADPVAYAAARPSPHRTGSPPSLLAARIAARVLVEADSEIGDVARRRVDDLIGYHDESYAKQYVFAVEQVRALEADRLGAAGAVTLAVAHGLHKLMAYKDEYEVARLSLDPALDEQIRDEFGPGARYSFQLHPPMLRALGLDRKIAVPTTARPAFAALRRLRRLRGTPLDPFGRAAIRRLERALPRAYLAAVRQAMTALTTETAPLVVQLAQTPDLVRGYESIKLDSVDRYRARVAALLAQLTASTGSCGGA